MLNRIEYVKNVGILHHNNFQFKRNINKIKKIAYYILDLINCFVIVSPL